jgi:hypothetical protein
MRLSTYVHAQFHGYCCFNQDIIRIEVITRETNSVYHQHKNTIFAHSLHWRELAFSDLCCDYGSHNGRDVQVGLTDRMFYQIKMGGLLVFPVCCVRFNLQDLSFIPT